jgi:hypothetical protein
MRNLQPPIFIKDRRSAVADLSFESTQFRDIVLVISLIFRKVPTASSRLVE